MNKIEAIQTKIDELEKEISLLRKKDKEKIIQENQWLIGKCLSRAYTSMEKIIGITDVIFSNNNKACKIQLECVYVFYDDRNDYKCTRIESNDYDEIDCESIKEYIDRYSVPLSTFNDFLNKAIKELSNL